MSAMELPEPIPVRDLARPEVQQELAEAAIVLAVDPMRTRPETHGSLVYGKPLVEDVARGQADEWGPQHVMRFSLDFESDELELLCAAVLHVKGSYTWNGETHYS